jgi:CRISPR/Cas system CSM-associated protein Csm3 (group 7 of RAMP superfamily)
MLERTLVVTLRLEEDLHAGTGLGRLGLIDDLAARDASGNPVVPAPTFRGLLREAGRDYFRLRESISEPDPKDEEGRLRKLLGEAGDEQGQATFTALRLDAQPLDLPEPFSVWASTAREPFSRRPDDETLRQIEFVRAGVVFRGMIRLDGDDEDVKLLERMLKRVEALGGSRTRGWGRVALESIEKVPVGAGGAPQLRLPSGPVVLRLLLRNLEPLNIARTAYAGNIVEGLPLIPGGTLRGALLGRLGEEFAASMAVGHAYVLPDDLAAGSGWKTAEIVPCPLSLQAAKSGQGGKADGSPWWSRPSGGDPRPAWPAQQDKLAPNPNKPEGLVHKRIKTDEWLVRAAGDPHWRRFRPAMAVRLRNAVPIARLEGDRPPDDEGLFSEQALREGQTFVAHVRFDDEKRADDFLQRLAPLFGPDDVSAAWLRIGRGGRPLRLLDAAIAPAPPAAQNAPADSLTVTLTSDLVARTAALTFATALDARLLIELLQDNTLSADGLTVEESVCETTTILGFNRATGLPRRPVLAIKLGSVVRIAAEDDVGRKNLAALRVALLAAAATGRGLGERGAEGLGRFVVDLDIHSAHYWEQAPGAWTPPRPAAKPNRTEEVLQQVMEFLKRRDVRDAILGKSDADAAGRTPSVAPWQWLRERGLMLDRGLTLKELLDEIKAHSNKLAGGATWAGVREPLAKALEPLTATDQRTFIENLARGAVALLRQERRK